MNDASHFAWSSLCVLHLFVSTAFMLRSSSPTSSPIDSPLLQCAGTDPGGTGGADGGGEGEADGGGGAGDADGGEGGQ